MRERERETKKGRYRERERKRERYICNILHLLFEGEAIVQRRARAAQR